MVPLTRRTAALVQRVAGSADAQRLGRRLLEEIPGTTDTGSRGLARDLLERIRISVLRLLHEGDQREDQVFDLARVDWRDLLMAAGHGEDVAAHEEWAGELLRA
jgi:hypothetical protein